MTPLCQLEEKLGVGFATGYKNDRVCGNSVHYIAENQKL